MKKVHSAITRIKTVGFEKRAYFLVFMLIVNSVLLGFTITKNSNNVVMSKSSLSEDVTYINEHSKEMTFKDMESYFMDLAQNAVCALPSCDPILITQITGTSAVASFDVTAGYGSGDVSDEDWEAGGARYASRTTYDYSYFYNRIPSGITPSTLPSSITQNDLISGGELFNNYYWYQYDGSSGPLTVGGPPPQINLANRRVIIFADSDVIIDTPIRLNNGLGFFMLIATGDITVNSTVGGNPDTAPDLEGIYLTEGLFATSTIGPDSDQQLHLRGVLVSDSVSFERDLPDNSLDPSELFEYAPDQILMFPPELSGQTIVWREIAP